MKKILFDCGTRDSLAAPGLLFFRVSVGLMMLIGHGIPKIQKFAQMKDGFYVPDFFPLYYLSPMMSLIGLILAEVGAASLIVLGLLTRPAAFILGFAMVVAAFGRHAPDPWFFAGGPAKELALMYLIPAITLILTGAGAYSFDAAIHKDSRRRRW
ncbi:MAG: DoxX family protein [Akkermansiaceae bacterium]